MAFTSKPGTIKTWYVARRPMPDGRIGLYVETRKSAIGMDALTPIHVVMAITAADAERRFLAREWTGLLP